MGGQVDSDADPQVTSTRSCWVMCLGKHTLPWMMPRSQQTQLVTTWKLSSWRRRKDRQGRRVMTVVMRSQKCGHSSHPKMSCSISKTLWKSHWIRMMHECCRQHPQCSTCCRDTALGKLLWPSRKRSQTFLSHSELSQDWCGWWMCHGV